MKKSIRIARLNLEPLENRDVPSSGLDLTGIEFRTFDGTNNNLANPTRGAAETRQIRNGYGAQFPDGYGDLIITAPQRLNPRSASNLLGNQTASRPDQRGLTDWATLWGQFITHDFGLTRNGPQFNQLFSGGVGDFNIPVLDPNDPLGPNSIRFNRSEYDPLTGTPDIFPGTTRLNRREVINSVTSYLDGSVVYGSDATRAAALREFVGGRLKVSAGNLLPFNTAGLPNDDPFGAGARLFLAGDVRANEQVGLMAVHTLFVREHNRLAGIIAQQNPTWTDEEIFQVARRIVGAQIQRITYEEYLPAILGWDLYVRPGDARYNPNVNASVTNAFAHAAFRFAHSQINDNLLLVNNHNQQVGNLTLRQAFFNVDFLVNNPANLDLVLKGQAEQLAQAVDTLYANAVRNNLFRPGGGGTDLLALDIQRGRDHGLPDYATLRRLYAAVLGITEPQITSFAQVTSDPVLQAKLEAAYGNVNNIDPIVGMLAEDHLPGASVGLLTSRILIDQFTRTRDGDRFFYTIDPFFQQQAIRNIINMDNVTLANIIRWNSGVTNIQDNVFFDRSVLVFQAPRTGANVTLATVGNTLVLFNNTTGRVEAVRSLAGVTRVVLVGSDSAPDTFNLFIARANDGIEAGVEIFGGRTGGDTLNVFGRLLQRDNFEVLPDSLRVNANQLFYRNIEQIRVVTQGGNDRVTIDPAVTTPVQVVDFFNPLSGNASSSNSVGGLESALRSAINALQSLRGLWSNNQDDDALGWLRGGISLS